MLELKELYAFLCDILSCASKNATVYLFMLSFNIAAQCF